MGNKGDVDFVEFPEYLEELTIDESINIVFQVNGKIRGESVVSADISDDELKEIALNHQGVTKYTEGKQIKKVIVVPKKLVNIVVI